MPGKVDGEYCHGRFSERFLRTFFFFNLLFSSGIEYF